MQLLEATFLHKPCLFPYLADFVEKILFSKSAFIWWFFHVRLARYFLFGKVFRWIVVLRGIYWNFFFSNAYESI